MTIGVEEEIDNRRGGEGARGETEAEAGGGRSNGRSARLGTALRDTRTNSRRAPGPSQGAAVGRKPSAIRLRRSRPGRPEPRTGCPGASGDGEAVVAVRSPVRALDRSPEAPPAPEHLAACESARV